MFAGLRLAAVTLIGLATVVSILGSTYGGLGQLITDGLQTFFPTKYVLGGVLSVVLALVVDVVFIRIERARDAMGTGSRRAGGAGMNETIGWLTDPRPGRGRRGSRGGSSSTSRWPACRSSWRP